MDLVKRYMNTIINGGIAMPNQDIINAHKHSSDHREELVQSTKAGCFYCLSVYNASDITDWIDNEQTALCPQCSIDSVIGDHSGYPITEEFLSKMESHWFGLKR